MKGMDVCDNQPGMNVCGNRSTKRRNAYMVALSWCSWRRVPRRSKNVLLAGSIALFPCHKKEVRKYIIASDQPIKLEIIDATKMSQLIKLSEGRPDPRACPSTMMIRASKFKHRRKRIFILGTVLTFKPAHVFNYIIPAMASTRGCLLFNCFRAHVHASTRWLQSKEVPFRVQQPLRNVPVWPWATR